MLSGQCPQLLEWQDDKGFRIDGVQFFATVDPAEYHTRKSTIEEFLIVKSRPTIEREIAIAPNKGRCNVLNTGIWQGRSVALYDLALAALEYNPNATEPLAAAYILERHREEIVQRFS